MNKPIKHLKNNITILNHYYIERGNNREILFFSYIILVVLLPLILKFNGVFLLLIISFFVGLIRYPYLYLDWGIDYTIYEFPSKGEVIVDTLECNYTVLSVDLKTGYIVIKDEFGLNEKISYRHYKRCFNTLSEIRNKKLNKILK